MRWPWEQPEQRSDHADRVAAYIMAQLGKAHSDISATAAARSAALMIARCFAAATPQGGDLAKLLTPDLLYRVGLGLVTHGEAVFVFDTVNGKLTLSQADAYHISGTTADPNSWRYVCELPTPDGSLKRDVTGAQVLHARLPSSQPWRGESPLAGLMTADLLAGIEAQLSGEAKAKSGYILPFGGAADRDPDDEHDPISTLADGMAAAKGATMIAETPSERAQGAATASSAPGYQISRFGINPPQAALQLRQDAAASIYSAVGIRAALFEQSSDGTSLRESARIFYASTLRPWGLLLSHDAARLFEQNISLDWHALNFHDGRTRSQIVTALKAADISQLDDATDSTAGGVGNGVAELEQVPHSPALICCKRIHCSM